MIINHSDKVLNMNKTFKLTLTFLFSTLLANYSLGGEKPIQHLKLESIDNANVAKSVFIKDTQTLRQKSVLTPKVLSEIHFLTYSLEKSIAYYVYNSEGDMQKLAKEMAIVVEEIHLSSENNRGEKTRQSLDKYFSLAEKFEAELNR